MTANNIQKSQPKLPGIRSTATFKAKTRALLEKPVVDHEARMHYLQEKYNISFEPNRAWYRSVKVDTEPKVRRKGLSLILSYGRNSSLDGEKSGSDMRQGQLSHDLCIKHELGDPDDIIYFFDYGISGTTIDRPELQRMLQLIKDNWGCDLIVEDVDRLVRIEEVMLLIGAQLVEGGIRLWDPDGLVTFDKFIEKGKAASHTWRLIAQRGAKIRRDNIRKGAVYRPAALGYEKGSRGGLQIGPKSEIIRELFRRRLEGAKFKELCRWLAEVGVVTKSGRIVSDAGVKRILGNRLYIGWLETTFKTGETVRHYMPDLQIVEDETFGRVQATLTKGERGAPSRHLKVKGQDGLIASSKFSCPCCGSRMQYRHFQKAKPKLSCPRQRTGKCTSLESFAYETAERQMLRVLAERLARPDFDDHYLKHEKEKYEQRASQLTAKKKRLDKEIARLQRNLNTAMRVMEDDDDFATTLMQHKSVLRQLKEDREKLGRSWFVGFAQSSLSSLPEELRMLERRSPFRPQNEHEQRVARLLHSIIREGATLRRIDEHRVQLDFELDFSSSLNRGESTIVLKESVVYEAKIWKALSEGEMVSKAIHDDTVRVDVADLDSMLAIPGFSAWYERHDSRTSRNALQVLMTVLLVECSMSGALKGLGYPLFGSVRAALDELRGADCFEAALAEIGRQRGALPGLQRARKYRRSTRSIRFRLQQKRDPLLDLRITQPGSEDRDLGDAEWSVVLARIRRDRRSSKPLWRDRIERMRDTLNCLFRILRKDLSAVDLLTRGRASYFGLMCERMTDAGEMDAAVQALLELDRSN